MMNPNKVQSRNPLGEVNILTNKNETNDINIEPYKHINYLTKAKILGHMMSEGSKMDHAVNDRLNKAKQAWVMINKN